MPTTIKHPEDAGAAHGPLRSFHDWLLSDLTDVPDVSRAVHQRCQSQQVRVRGLSRCQRLNGPNHANAASEKTTEHM